MPDFLLAVTGDVPLPDNDVFLIGVQLRNTTPKALTMKGKLSWDFGDGQTYDGGRPRRFTSTCTPGSTPLRSR